MDDFQGDIDVVSRVPAIGRLLETVCRTTGMGFSAVARVTQTHWVCCVARDEIGFGLVPGGELKIETTICNEIRDSRLPVVIDEVSKDKDFRYHNTPAMYGFESYISAPIMLTDGSMFGTLCAIDPKPAKVKNPTVIGMFEAFAELIGHFISQEQKVQNAQNELQSEQMTSELREQFIAVLGHDLRNPLQSIDAGIRMLRKQHGPDQILNLMEGSTHRMAVLIDNVMDFARGKLGGGITLNRVDTTISPILMQVVAEIQSTHPDTNIHTTITLDEPINCDPSKISQLLSNLLGNAATHGDPAKPIVVSATGNLTLSVSNGGPPIPPQARERLFMPFSRGTNPDNQQGLGLGLYIAAEIANAHGGTLDMTSTAEETKFTFKMSG